MQNRYVVIDADRIVAEDLAHAIRVHDRAAEVAVFPTPEAAVDDLAQRRPRAVLIHCDPLRFSETPAAALLREMEVPYAFRGMVSETEAGGAAVLASPFSETTVAALLRKLTGEVPG